MFHLFRFGISLRGPEVLALQFVPQGSTDIAVSNRVRPITLKSQGVSIHFSTPLTAAVACLTLLHIVIVVASEADWKAKLTVALAIGGA